MRIIHQKTTEQNSSTKGHHIVCCSFLVVTENHAVKIRGNVRSQNALSEPKKKATTQQKIKRQAQQPTRLFH